MTSYERIGTVDGVATDAAGRGLPALPQRKRLDHRGPLEIDVSSAWYFITICAERLQPWTVGGAHPCRHFASQSSLRLEDIREPRDAACRAISLTDAAKMILTEAREYPVRPVLVVRHVNLKGIKMTKLMSLLIFGLMVCVSCGAASTHLSLDNRTGSRIAAVTERIVFSPAWETDAAGATAVVSVNGEVVKNATADGVYEWTPAADGIYQLTHAVFANGVQVGETLAATFKVGAMAVAPTAMDWKTGTIEIGWEGFASAGTGSQVTYDVYWSTKSNGIDHVVREAVTGLSCTDDKYLDHGEDDDGICPIYYTVVGSDGSKGCCLTRRRYAMAIGYTTLQNPVSMSAPNANAFWNQFLIAGGVVDPGDVVCLRDANATNEEIKKRLDWVADRVRPGDIFAFYVTTHGVRNWALGGFVGIQTYSLPDKCMYKIQDLGDGFDKIGENDALVISILDTCGSGQLADRASEAKNTAWITAAKGNQGAIIIHGKDDVVTYHGWEYSYFGLAFLDWGWEKGFAGRSGSATYYDLAEYVTGTVKGSAFDDLQTPQILHGELIRNVKAFSNVQKATISRPLAPVNVSVKEDSASLNVSWDRASDASYYVVRWREEGGSDAFGKMWLRTANTLLKLTDDATSFKPVPGERYEFCVSAVNAAGESEMSSVAVGGVEYEPPQYLKPWLDLATRHVEVRFSMQLDENVSALELVLEDDGVVAVTGKTSDGVEFETTSRIVSIENDMASIPICCSIGETGRTLNMVVKMSSNGRISLDDGAYWTDGEIRDAIELVEPLKVTATPQKSVLMEGESAVLDVTLSEPCSRGVYVYLRPMNEAASNCCASLLYSTISASSAGLCISPGKTACTGQLDGLDGGRSRLEFKPVVCTSSTFDESKVLSEYEGEPFELEVRNVAPELIVVGWGDPDQIMSVAMGQDVVIRYQVRDVAADLQAGVSVSFAGDGVASETVTVTDGGLHQQVVRFTTAGTHAVRITAKDKDGASAVRTLYFSVQPQELEGPAHETEMTPVPVPFEVIEAKYKHYLDAAGGDYEAAALAVGRNGYAIWECYVAGLEPDDQDSKFKIVDIKFEDGELKVMWSPDLNENGTKNVRKYTEFGRKKLGGTEAWTDMKDVNPAEKNDYKFRKVTVDMP